MAELEVSVSPVRFGFRRVLFCRLMEMVDERLGKSVTFHTCVAAGMNLDERLHFLEACDMVRITGGVVLPGSSPTGDH